MNPRAMGRAARDVRRLRYLRRQQGLGRMHRPQVAPIHRWLNRRWALIEAGLSPREALERAIWWAIKEGRFGPWRVSLDWPVTRDRF